MSNTGIGMNASNSPDHEDAPIVADRLVYATFARLNARAWGIAFALLCGIGILTATWVLVLQGGELVGPHLALLSVFFPGYAVSFVGGLIGFVYAFVIGYGLGRLIGTLYNKMLP
jgi:hypothetical protein